MCSGDRAVGAGVMAIGAGCRAVDAGGRAICAVDRVVFARGRCSLYTLIALVHNENAILLAKFEMYLVFQTILID